MYCRQRSTLRRLNFGPKDGEHHRHGNNAMPARKRCPFLKAGLFSYAEGRISVLFRGRGMKRCLAEGHQRFELWVGAAVLANNLMRIAALLTKRVSRKRRAA
jgi:hypothetical protein